ncbi:ACT domain-containing protein [Nitratireductor sp. CAU 1489]|uniref:ACT domain-containing protein n=1 Tax=Nitratireductor arenosus TaxID=2682096 RepID=A0A844QEL9_9HYPH|nr:ACT domain-containing protein [Nitratireductor arenosus]MVA96470.1 ACT domain-containing protein [Nitratireductor arenosus]
MPGETNLETLLATMAPRLHDEAFAYVTITPGKPEPDGLEPVLRFEEPEGTTLVVPRRQALQSGLDPVFACKMITLEVHSALEAVGFLAALLPPLAAAGIGVNPVSAYFHDHLLVPADRAGEAVAILEGIAEKARGGLG